MSQLGPNRAILLTAVALCSLQSLPAGKAVLFSPGIISSELPEFATSFSQDGNTVYFNRMSADRTVIRIWSSTRTQGEWSEPEPMPFSDGTYRDVDPFMAPDGRRLYFSSTRPIAGDAPKDYDLWYVERLDDRWGAPVNLGEGINSEADEVYSTLAANGSLYYSALDADSDRVTVYRAEWIGGEFEKPQEITIGDGHLRLTNPTVAPDESYLLMVADHDGQPDIHISSRRHDGTWADAVRLGDAVNSPFPEFAPAISPDGSRIYFTSERPGMLPAPSEGRAPGDIYSIATSEVLRPPG